MPPKQVSYTYHFKIIKDRDYEANILFQCGGLCIRKQQKKRDWFACTHIHLE